MALFFIVRNNQQIVRRRIQILRYLQTSLESLEIDLGKKTAF